MHINSSILKPVMYTNIIAAASQHWVRVCIHKDKITTLALVQRGGTKEGRGEEEAQEGMGKGKEGGPKGGGGTLS